MFYETDSSTSMRVIFVAKSQTKEDRESDHEGIRCDSGMRRFRQAWRGDSAIKHC